MEESDGIKCRTHNYDVDTPVRGRWEDKLKSGQRAWVVVNDEGGVMMRRGEK